MLHFAYLGGSHVSIVNFCLQYTFFSLDESKFKAKSKHQTLEVSIYIRFSCSDKKWYSKFANTFQSIMFKPFTDT